MRANRCGFAGRPTVTSNSASAGSSNSRTAVDCQSTLHFLMNASNTQVARPPLSATCCCSEKPRIHVAATQKLWASSIHPVLGLTQRDRDVRDMTVLCYVAVAWERNSKRDGRLLLTRQDVFSGKG